MSTLTKLVLGAMGALHPRPPVGDAAATIELPPPDLSGGAGLLEALGKRRSSREFRRDALPMEMLSTLLWAANGVNRPDGGRTAPSALVLRDRACRHVRERLALRYRHHLHPSVIGHVHQVERGVVDEILIPRHAPQVLRADELQRTHA